MTDDPLRLLASARPAPPPAALREAALARALAAWPEGPPRAHWVDRRWASRRLRLAWAIAMLLLAALDLALTPGALPGLSRPGATLDEARSVLRAELGTPSPGPRPARSPS